MANYLVTSNQTALPYASLASGDSLTIASGAGLYVPALSISAGAGASFIRLTILGDLVAASLQLNASNTLTIGAEGSFVSIGLGSYAIQNTAIGGSTLMNLGTIAADSADAVILMRNSDILENRGTVHGNAGIVLGTDALGGSSNTLINSGLISTNAVSVAMFSGDSYLQNSGVIQCSDSYTVRVSGLVDPFTMDVLPTDQTIVNSGDIIGRTSSATIYVTLTAAASTLFLTNSGTISAPLNAIESLGASTEIIRNSGPITGDVILNGGDDFFDGRGGTLDGDIFGGQNNDMIDLRGATLTGNVDGGTGSDTFLVSDSATTIFDQGTDIDTVLATNSFRLALNLEILTLLGAGNSNGFGNTLDNTLTGNIGDNRLAGLDGNDTLSGDLGNDRLTGGNGSDSLDAGDGNDVLLGGLANDTLRGGDGDDQVNGGAGKDLLTGNGGADVFVFTSRVHSSNLTTTADIITDFVRGDDQIDLRAIDANINNAGANDTFAVLGVAAFSNVAGQLRISQSGGNTFVELDVNGDSVADGLVRLTGLYTRNANDFAL